MDIQEIQERFEDLMLANPDFDESLLEKDEEGSYEDSSIQDMYSMFEAGTEVGEQSKQAQKVAVPQWVDYTKQSPSKDGRYQVFINGEQLIADWEAPYGFSDPYDGCALNQELITHWAELPQSPVAKEPK